tara:strand:- start:479 stop:766 length:288 start_codon:yes stop_codon:yes gene_type:complete
MESDAFLAEDGLILVEVWGSLCHPASTATIPLLRGSHATDPVLVHRDRQKFIKRLPKIPLPPLRELLECKEALARQAVADLEEDLNLTCTDSIRW